MPVTRELACKIIAAALGLGYPAGTVLEFTDSGDIGSDYLGSVMALYANGLLDGYEDNTLRPQATLTRAQAATLLYRASHIGDEPEETAPAITAAGYTADQIINYFCDVALGAEYGDASENVIKWVEPFTYYIEGEATDADLAQINALIEAINRVPGFPGMSEAGSAESADLTIHFVDADGIIAATGNSYNGYVNIWWSDYCIENGDIYYRTDITQELRNAVIVEELCQSLGLLTDTYDHPESIFYQYHTDTAWPTTLDWAVIQLLYRSEITPGMDEEAVREARPHWSDNHKRKDECQMPNPVVTIEMENGGVIKAELYPEIAPNTVNNFLSLVNSGFYNGLIFHRVIPGFMIQGGDPQGTGMGGPGYRIKGEFKHNGFSKNNLKHDRGVLSMARSMMPDTAGSQFFIMHDKAPHLDGEYAAFGKVIEGMEVVDEIANTPTDYNDRPKTEQRIKTATAETFGVDYPEPVKF